MCRVKNPPTLQAGGLFQTNDYQKPLAFMLFWNYNNSCKYG